MVRRILSIACVCVLLACSTATRIITEPPGAIVYVDGSMIGKTPVVYHSERGLPKRFHIEMYRKGFEPIDLYVDTQMSVGWGITASFLFLPYLWAWRLEEELVFNMQPKPGNENYVYDPEQLVESHPEDFEDFEDEPEEEKDPADEVDEHRQRNYDEPRRRRPSTGGRDYYDDQDASSQEPDSRDQGNDDAAKGPPAPKDPEYYDEEYGGAQP